MNDACRSSFPSGAEVLAGLHAGDSKYAGFTLRTDETGHSLVYRMPQELQGKMRARLFSRGPLLDATAGNPARIFERLQHLLQKNILISPWQVHGTAILEGRKIWGMPQRVKADGIHLDRAFDPGQDVVASLRFADCAPVLIASAEPYPWLMALHSGFHGTVQNIFRAAWTRAENYYRPLGGASPAKTYVWIGPAIGPCCYSRKLSDPTTPRALEVCDANCRRIAGDSAYFDITGLIAGQASAAGIPADHIFRIDACTACNADFFYSYRAGDAQDRMVLLAQLGDGENLR